MQDARDERLNSLYNQAATEQDTDKLLVLIQEINDLLEEKRKGKTEKAAD